MKSKKQS